jgi:hypothetical protein
MQLTRNALVALLGLSGSVRLSVKKRVRVGTSAIFRIVQRGGRCQMRGSMEDN